MQRTIAILVALAMLIVPGVASAQSFGLDVVPNTAQWASGHHWKFAVDNSSVVPSTDTFSYIVGEMFGTIPMKGGGSRWVSVGSYAKNTGVTQFFTTGATTDVTCISPYTKAFNNMGCEGTPDLWGRGKDQMVTYELDFYPAFPPNYPDMWEAWVQDINGVFHPIATLLNATGTFNNPHISTSAVYPGTQTGEFPMIEVLYSHPLTWQGGSGPNWIDPPTAASSFTYTSPMDSIICPGWRAINRFPDKHTWLVGNPLIFPVPFCTTSQFWP